MHADHIQERLAVHIEPRARSARNIRPLRQRSSRAQRRARLRNPRRLPVRIAAQNRSQRRRKIAPRIRVIRQPKRHQQRAQVRIPQPQRPVVVRVLRNLLRRIARRIHDDLHRRRHDRNRMTIRGNVELPARRQELQQIEARQVASRVIQEHVLAAGIRRIDPRRSSCSCASG